MKSYWVVFRSCALEKLQYRSSALAGVATQFFWGVLRVMIFTAFYQSVEKVHPMSLGETINYVWLGQAFFFLLPFNTDSTISELIRNGNVAYEMARPVDLYYFWFSRSIAFRCIPTLMRMFPIFILATLFFQFTHPTELQTFLIFLFSLGCSLLLNTAITMLATLSLFWTISGEGVTRILPAVVYIFSGMIIPLPLFPEWSQPILKFLPFSGMLDTPFRIYVGNLDFTNVWVPLLNQIFWILALGLLGKLLFQQGLKRVVVQGG